MGARGLPEQAGDLLVQFDSTDLENELLDTQDELAQTMSRRDQRLQQEETALANLERDAAMADFTAGRTRLLVATTVIEVGVDVPNASLMIIENAERLGLAQLHQLRGRVGRGSEQSSCVLLYSHPVGQLARERLNILRETTDGFRIAEKDLELRGPGEVLGTRQTGLMAFRIAELPAHQHLLGDVQTLADDMRRNHPQLIEPLILRWTGANREYGKV